MRKQGLGDLAKAEQQDGADQRPENSAEPADNRSQQRINRNPRAVGNIGVQIEKFLRIESAGGGSHGG